MKASGPYHHGNLRQALLDSSLALIRESGPDGFTLREVARRAGVSHTAPYRHFRDKSDLLASVAEDGFGRLRQAMLKAIEGKLSNRIGALERAGVAYVDFALRHPEHFQVMFSTAWPADVHPGAYAAAEQAFRVLLNLVRGAVGGDPLIHARMTWSLVHGIATLGIDKQLQYGRTELRRFTSSSMTALLRGLV